MNVGLQTACNDRNIRLGTDQLDVLRNIIGDVPVASWPHETQTESPRIILIDDVPRWTEVDTICRTLSPRDRVVIPMSENPAFDFVKSKLFCHGVIGASGPKSPHQIWWGGIQSAQQRDTDSFLSRALIVSCVREGTEEDIAAQQFERVLDQHNIAHKIQRIGANQSIDDHVMLRSLVLLEAWTSTDRSLIWIDPVVDGHFPTVLIDLRYIDFSATPIIGSGLSTSFLYFSRSERNKELLQSWNSLCHEFNHLPAGYLLDATWGMVTAQRMLTTAWSPSSRLATLSCTGSPDLLAGSGISLGAQREARRACRTGGAEPHYLQRGHFPNGPTLTVLMQSERAAPHAVSETMQSVIDAFNHDAGMFGTLGVLIAKNAAEAANITETTLNGWVLYVSPGAIVDNDALRSLSHYTVETKPLFVMPTRSMLHNFNDSPVTYMTKSQAIFFNAQAPGEIARAKRNPPMLKVVARAE